VTVPIDGTHEPQSTLGEDVQVLRPWQWFWGSSFERPVQWPDAQGAVVDWLKITARKYKCHIYAFWAIEERNGSHHVHALLEVSGKPLTSKTLKASWRRSGRTNGLCMVRRFDPSRRGGQYVVKFGLVDMWVGCSQERICRRRGCVHWSRWKKERATLRGRHRVALGSFGLGPRST
jgi:hypothetical protein